MAKKKNLTERKEKIDSVKKEIKKKVSQRVQKPQNAVTFNKLKLLITVVGRKKAEYFCDLLQSFDVNMQIITLANGTANEKMMSYLGLRRFFSALFRRIKFPTRRIFSNRNSTL